jgi:hypothetical protein
MRLLEKLRRWLRLPRSFESVAAEIADGLRDGTIVLRHEEQPPDPDEVSEVAAHAPPANEEARPPAPIAQPDVTVPE